MTRLDPAHDRIARAAALLLDELRSRSSAVAVEHWRAVIDEVQVAMLRRVVEIRTESAGVCR